MTLENLKDFWKDISLKHKDVKQFNVGSWYDAASNTSDKYPLVFWEMPYSITMDLNKPLDTIICSLSVFLHTKQDDIADSHQAISFAKTIGDAIILKGRGKNEDCTDNGFSVDSVNAISVREYSDDEVSGIRYDLTLTVIRDLCVENIDEYFNE